MFAHKHCSAHSIYREYRVCYQMAKTDAIRQSLMALINTTLVRAWVCVCVCVCVSV
jgi:hypothetical protein